MFRRFLPRLLIVFILFVGLSSIISAQGGSLTYGTMLTDTLNPGTPIIYTFSGLQNDVVSVYVIGSSDLQPTVSIANSSGQSLAFSNTDALTPMSNDVRATAQLPANDTYIITVNNQSAVAGTFTLALSVADALESTVLADRLAVTIAPNGAAQQFTIPANPNIPQVLSIQSLNATLGYSATLRSGDGTILAAIAGGLGGSTFVLPPSTTPYTLVVNAADSTLGAEVEVAILAGGTAPLPATTEEAQQAQPAQPADPNACTVTANGVNVRSGPGTGYGVIGSLNDGNQLIATGQNSGWYNGTYNGQSAWVAASVVNAAGNCSLPTVDAPPLPAAPAPASTEETNNNNQSSSTATATATTDNNNNNNNTQATNTTAPTATATVTTTPFNVVSISCRYFQNDGATVDFNVTGGAGATFQIDVRQNNTVYSANRTLNQQGFLNGNHRFGQAGNSNYTAYIVYNGVDVASAEC